MHAAAYMYAISQHLSAIGQAKKYTPDWSGWKRILDGLTYILALKPLSIAFQMAKNRLRSSVARRQKTSQSTSAAGTAATAAAKTKLPHKKATGSESRLLACDAIAMKTHEFHTLIMNM